jgi:hypothetical protein
MAVRTLALLLLLGAAAAQAQHAPGTPPEAQATPPSAAGNIDVDAMARAKDADANATTQDAAMAPTAGDAPAPPSDDASAAPPADSAPPTAETPAAPASAEPAPAQAPAPAAPAPSAAPPAAPDAADTRLAAACESRSKSLLDAAQKGDYATATSDFDAKMRSALPVAKFRKMWESLAQFGALQARGQSHPARSEGYIAVTIPLIFDKANLYAQVACGSDGRIAGFHVKPLPVPAP